jgi:hypothetical protein
MRTNKTIWMVLLLAAGFLAAAQVLTVGVLKTNVMAKPDFLSSALGTLKKGDKLDVLQESGSWYLVKGPGGLKGYVHKSAVQASRGGGLSGLLPGQKSASQDEVALAAKGFNEANEKRIRGSKGFNFADLEWVMAQGGKPDALADFLREGKLK